LEDPNVLDNFLLISLTPIKSRLSRLYLILDSYLTVEKNEFTSNKKTGRSPCFRVIRISLILLHLQDL